MADIAGLFKDKSFLLKFVAWILSFVGLVILCAWGIGGSTTYFEHMLVYVAIPGYFYILLGILLTYLFDTPHKFLELFFLIGGAILNIAAGIVLLVEFLDMQDPPIRLLVLAIVTIIAGILMAIEVFFIFKK